MVSIYGSEAGNLALKVLSVGGLYVGGGIAPQILEKLKDGTFMKAFRGQGTLEPVADQHAGASHSGQPRGADGRGGVCRGAGGGDEQASRRERHRLVTHSDGSRKATRPG